MWWSYLTVRNFVWCSEWTRANWCETTQGQKVRLVKGFFQPVRHHEELSQDGSTQAKLPEACHFAKKWLCYPKPWGDDDDNDDGGCWPNPILIKRDHWPESASFSLADSNSLMISHLNSSWYHLVQQRQLGPNFLDAFCFQVWGYYHARKVVLIYLDVVTALKTLQLNVSKCRWSLMTWMKMYLLTLTPLWKINCQNHHRYGQWHDYHMNYWIRMMTMLMKWHQYNHCSFALFRVNSFSLIAEPLRSNIPCSSSLQFSISHYWTLRMPFYSLTECEGGRCTDLKSHSWQMISCFPVRYQFERRMNSKQYWYWGYMYWRCWQMISCFHSHQFERKMNSKKDWHWHCLY